MSENLKGTITDLLNKENDSTNGLLNNKVANFAYTEDAYTNDDAAGVPEYDTTKEQNIPVGTAEVVCTNQTVLNKGFRAKAAQITRMINNHFFGRTSYNLNKIHDWFADLLTQLKLYLTGSINEYSEDVTYAQGERCFVETTVWGKPVKKVYRATSESVKDKNPLTNSDYWQLINSYGDDSTKYSFTYVINSVASFTALMNNTEGNDYTSVLIKNIGSNYTLPGIIDLDATGTILLVAEEGVEIDASGMVPCIQAQTEDLRKIKIRNIKINMTLSSSDNGVWRTVFHQCTNLEYCSAVFNVVTTGVEISSNTITGFNECYYCKACTVTFNMPTTDIIQTSYFYGFKNSLWLTRSEVIIQNADNLILAETYIYAYSGSDHMMQCKFLISGLNLALDESINGANNIIGFYDCLSIIDCYVGIDTITGYLDSYTIIGFSHCITMNQSWVYFEDFTIAVKDSSNTVAIYGIADSSFVMNSTVEIDFELTTQIMESYVYGGKTLYGVINSSFIIIGSTDIDHLFGARLYSIGLSSSYRISQCRACGIFEGEETITVSKLGLGFSNCYQMHACWPHQESTTNNFSGCYASNVANSDYEVADTPEGGFNEM